MPLLISKLQLGQDETSFEDYLVMEVKTSLKLNVVCQRFIYGLGWKREPPSFDLNIELLDPLDVGEGVPLVMKLANAQHQSSIVSYVFYGHPIRVHSFKCNETNKPYQSGSIRHHIGYYFKVATSI